jgi:hypothetical protein
MDCRSSSGRHGGKVACPSASQRDNTRTLHQSPSPAADWSVQRRLEYVEWAKAVVARLRATSTWLEQQFDEAADQAMLSLNQPVAVECNLS